MTQIGNDSAWYPFARGKRWLSSVSAGLGVFLLFNSYFAVHCAEAQTRPHRRILILNEVNPAYPAVNTAVNREMFDWRALRRWGLKVSGLPTGSALLNQEPSLWGAYGRYVAAGVLVLFAQALIILVLLRQRSRRLKTEAKLLLSNEQLRLAVEAGKCVAWDLDIKSGRTRWFGDLPTMFGMSSEIFVGQAEDFYRYIHPEDRERVLDALFKSRQNHQPYSAEFRLLLPDGTIRWIDDRGEHEYAKNGEPDRIAGMAVDITERKQADEALKKSEEKFSKAFRESPLALTLTSMKDHRYIEVNETYERVTGWSRDEIIGRTPLDIGIWMNPAERTEVISRLLAEGRLRDAEFRFRTKDGEVRTALASSELIEINDEPCAISAIADITEVKRASEAKQAMEDRFAQFFATLPEYCFMSCANGDILDVNPAACKALGYARDELIGKSLSTIYALGSLSKLVYLLDSWHSTGTLHDEEMVIVTKEGQKRSVLLNAGSVKDAAGNLLYSTTVLVDVTERKQIEKRLFESQNRLESIIGSAMDAIIAIDEEQQIVIFNEAAEKMFRCPIQEAVGTSIERFIPHRFHAAHKGYIHQFAETGATIRTLDPLRALSGLRTGGEEFPIEASISQVETGDRRLFTVIIRDITERKLAEEARFRYAAIVESSDDAIISLDLDGTITSWNFGARRMYGYTESETIGKPITMIIPPEVRADEERLLNRIRAGERIEHYETVRLAKGGKQLDVSLTISPLCDWTGKTIGVSKIVRDITLSKQAEAALRESEERFRHVANAAPVLIWMSGPDKLCTYFNQSWLNFTGRPLHSELGNGWAGGVHPDDLNECLRAYTSAFEQREPFEMEYRLRRYDGEYRWIFDRGVPRINQDGSLAGYIGSAIDVTDRKLAEESLSNMSRKLIEAQEQERMWIARELHDDINQRIALASVNLERLQQDLVPLPSRAAQQFGELKEQLSSMGSDIQALSHHLHSSKLEYLGIVSAATSFCRELSQEKEVEVEFQSENIPKNLPHEIALCLFRVLQESLQNALKHSDTKHFEVSLMGTPKEIGLTVRDGGVGFDAEMALTGRGLGLTSMKERLKLVQGELVVDSEPGRGTVIRATVPLSLAARAACAGT